MRTKMENRESRVTEKIIAELRAENEAKSLVIQDLKERVESRDLHIISTEQERSNEHTLFDLFSDKLVKCDSMSDFLECLISDRLDDILQTVREEVDDRVEEAVLHAIENLDVSITVN